MDFLIDYWGVLFGIFAVGAFVGAGVYKFATEPSYQQKEDLKQWLKGAMYKAEKELGSKTGELKLLTVYNMFVTALPWMARVITFEQFSDYVLECMEWLNNKLEEENDNK